MRRDRKRVGSTAESPATYAKTAPIAELRRSSVRHIPIQSANTSATPSASARNERRRMSVQVPTRAPSEVNSSASASAGTPVRDASPSPKASSTKAAAAHAKASTASESKKSRKASAVAVQTPETPSLPTSPPKGTTSRDAVVVPYSAAVAAVSVRHHNTSSTANMSATNSSGSTMSRGGSIRISPGSTNHLMSPINEIHGSLAQLYLTPISTSLSSSSPQAGFTALQFDGRSASWSNGAGGGGGGGGGGNAVAVTAASSTNSPAAASNHLHRRSGSGSAARLRHHSIGDSSSGPRYSGDSAGSSACAADEWAGGPPLQLLQQGASRARAKGPPISPARVRSGTQVHEETRRRPTFSAVGAEGPDTTAAARPHSSASVTTLFATTNTLTVPQTPPIPPPLLSTMNASGAASAGRRLPPSPPRLEEGEVGSGDGRRDSWNLVSSWAPTSTSPSSLAVFAGPPVVVKTARRASRAGSSGGGTDYTGRSSTMLEFSEDPLLSTSEVEALALQQRRRPKAQSTVFGTSANSRTAAMTGGEESPPDQSMYSFSVSFASGATSTMDDLPPPPPPPPAQLNFAGHRHAALPPHPPRTANPNAMSPTAADSSPSLFLDTNTWQSRADQQRRSNSASFSIRQTSVVSLNTHGDGVDDGSLVEGSSTNSNALPHRGSFFSTSRVSLGGAEPFTLAPSTAAASRGGDGANRYGVDGEEGASSLVRHGASYGVSSGGWGEGGQSDSRGPPPLSLQPGAPTDGAGGPPAFSLQPSSAAGQARAGSGSSSRPPKPPALHGFSPTTAGAASTDNPASPEIAPVPESSLVIKERVGSAGPLTVHGEEAPSRQQELAQSFRNRIQVGVRAPRRKQTVRRVSANARNQQRRGSASDGSGSSGGSHRSSGGRSGSTSSSGGSSRRRSGTSRRSGKSTGAASSTQIPTFVRACFVMLACAKLLRVVTACRARHRYAEVDAPHAAFVIQCAWRRRQQRRRIRERNAVQLLVPWARLYLQRLRKTKETSALLLQRVFRGQVDRSFHQFLYACMQYNKALDVISRAVRRWEAQKMLSALRLQRDERVVLIGQCVQCYLRVLREEQLGWAAIVDKATLVLGTRPSVTTRDWVSGVAARTGVVLNPALTAASTEDDQLFDLQAASGAAVADTRTSELRRLLVGVTQLESYTYLDPAKRTRKLLRTGPESLSTVSGLLPESQLHLVERSDATAAAEGSGTDQLVMPASVTDKDVVDAYIQLLVRIESAERVELERQLHREHAAVLHTPFLINEAVACIVAQQLPLLFAPLLLAMSSIAVMRQAVRLFEAERTARCQIISLYESMPLTCLSRPMLNPAAGQRHGNLMQLANRAPDPWLEAEQNERRLFHEWTNYQHRSAFGMSGSKSITSPALPNGYHHFPTSPNLPRIAGEESVTSAQLEMSIPAPILLEPPQRLRSLAVSAQASSATQRPAGGIRVRMTASLRSAGGAASPEPSSVPSAALSPPTIGFGSVSASAAPSDSYTRVEVKSKTAIPCPKRRPRGAPLPLLRTFAAASTAGGGGVLHGQGQSSHRPSFRGSCGSFTATSHSTLRAPDPNNVTLTGVLRGVREGDDDDSAGGNPVHPQTILDNLGGRGNLLRVRQALEHHRMSASSVTNTEKFVSDVPDMASRIYSAGVDSSPHRSDRRTTAAPSALSLAPASAWKTDLSLGRGADRTPPSTLPRPSQVRLLSSPDDRSDDMSREKEGGASDERDGFLWVPSMCANPLPAAAGDFVDWAALSLGTPAPEAEVVRDEEESPAVSAGHDGQSHWTASATPQRQLQLHGSVSRSSSSSSLSDASTTLLYGSAGAARQGGAATVLPVLPRRPPTPPPRRCHAMQPVSQASSTPLSLSSSSKAALDTVTTAIFDSVVAAAPAAATSTNRRADEIVAGRADAALSGGQRPASSSGSSSSNTNWTLSPNLQPIAAAAGDFLSSAASTRLPAVSQRSAP